MLRAVPTKLCVCFRQVRKNLFFMTRLSFFYPVPFNMQETTCETTWFDDEGRKVSVPPNTRWVYYISNPTLCFQTRLFDNAASETWRILGSWCTHFRPGSMVGLCVKRYTFNPFIFLAFNEDQESYVSIYSKPSSEVWFNRHIRQCLGQQFAYLKRLSSLYTCYSALKSWKDPALNDGETQDTRRMLSPRSSYYICWCRYLRCCLFIVDWLFFFHL